MSIPLFLQKICLADEGRGNASSVTRTEKTSSGEKNEEVENEHI